MYFFQGQRESSTSCELDEGGRTGSGRTGQAGRQGTPPNKQYLQQQQKKANRLQNTVKRHYGTATKRSITQRLRHKT